MNSIHADGGWVLALTLTILFVGLTFAAVRKRWPATGKPTLVVVDGVSVVEDAPKKAKALEKPSHGHGSKHTLLSLSGVIVLWVGIVGMAIYIILHLPAIGDTMFRFVGIKVVQPSQAYVSQRANVGPAAGAIRQAARAERERIEGERHVLNLTYGDHLRWIPVPTGGYITHFTVDDKKVVGTQCSSSPPNEEPPTDASGEAYECHDGITTNWVRFYAWDIDEGPVTVHYQFQYAF